eukprot:2059123-Amphidinium_carterae.1
MLVQWSREAFCVARLGVGGYSSAAHAASEALEKAKRAAMFQRQIQEPTSRHVQTVDFPNCSFLQWSATSGGIYPDIMRAPLGLLVAHEQMQKLKTQGLGGGFLPGEGPKARKLILDEFGRELDEEGNVVPMKPQVWT